MKSCIYARKSTRKVNQTNTIKNQIKICTRYAQDNNLEVVDVKVDVGSGKDELNRDEINNLIKDGINGNYQCVILKGISRLYRNTRKGLELDEKLHMHSIRIIVLEEMFDSRHNIYSNGSLDISKLTMYLMFAEMESDKISERVKLTQLEKAYQGMWVNPSNVPFGYKYNPVTKKLAINDNSEVVRLIFSMYLEGNTIKEITKFLDSQNIKPPKSNLWREDAIRYILKNQVYIGKIKYTQNNKNNTSKAIYVENTHNPIIEEEVFQKAQLKINKNKRSANKNNQSILKGLVFCSKCKLSMTRRQYQYNGTYYFYCSGYIKCGKEFCSSNKINADDLEGKVRILARNYFKQTERLPIKQKEHNDIKNKINNNRKKFENIFDKLLNSAISNKDFNEVNKKLADELNCLILKSKKIQTEINKLRHIKNIDGWSLFFIKEIPKAHNKLEDIIKRIEVFNGEVRVEFY